MAKASRSHRAALALGAGLVAAIALHCAPDVWSGRGQGDVLLITIDTARADKFSYAGASSVQTSNIDRLAQEGTAFLQAVTPAPVTLVAHASLFTGQLPVTHGVRNNGTYRLGSAATTLPELLKDRGYRNGAFVGAAVLDARHGLDQGFDHYDDEVYEDKYRPERRGEEVVNRALQWLQAEEGPTFIWVHLFDPHEPYDPPAPERARFPHSPYDGEIAYVDRVIGKLLDGYRASGRYDDALVVLTSDHGESLGEHGEESHGVFIYDATVRVPLLIRAPGLGRGRRVEAQVQLVDILPTVAELAGAELPQPVRGRSLVPMMRGGTMDESPAYLESLFPRENFGWSELRGVRSRGWKLIFGVEPELYDLRSDVEEIHDLAADEPRRAAALESLLRSDFAEREAVAGQTLALDSETRRRLEALGYLGAGLGDGPQRGDEAAAQRPDPRRLIHLNRARSTAPELFDRGFHQAGIARLENVLREDPANPWLRHQLLKMLVASGQRRRAEQRAASMVRAGGAGQEWDLLAQLLEREGREREAVEAYAAAMRADPGDAEARSRRWELLLELGERDRVALEAAAALESSPGDGGAIVSLARARWAGRSSERLEGQLRSELEIRPDDPAILAGMGDALFEQGRFREALPFHNRAQSLEPAEQAYGIKLARTLAALERPEGVRHVLRNQRSRGMLRPEAWLLLRDACLDLGDRPCAIAAMHRVTALIGGRPGEGQRAEEGRGDSEAALRRGLALLAAGSAAEARPMLESLYRSDPLDLDAALAFGRACAAAGDSAALRETLTLLAETLLGADGDLEVFRTGEADPATARLQTARALSLIGTESWEAGDYWNALHAYLLGEVLIPDDPRFSYNIGLAWERVGDWTEALAAFEKTLRLDPEFPRAGEHRQALLAAVRGPSQP